ncbi:MAG TPA: hypothetical protein VF503_06725 [Sphingobium sp.]|uniref:hypothetical protein n=1 Tax=Sphingobium sp. TaxID=1912891 RepID=UPI002ED2F68D
MRYRLTGAIMSAVLFAGVASAQGMAPHANDHAPANPAVKNNHVMPVKTPAGGANSFTEGQARSRISKAGFTHISALRKDKDGLWQGTARSKGHKRHVALDYKGNVSSR